MRSLAVFVALIIAGGVLVARVADKLVIDYQSSKEGDPSATATKSSSGGYYPPSQASRQSQPAQAPVRDERPRNRLPEVIRMSPSASMAPPSVPSPSTSSSPYGRSVTLRSDNRGHFKVEARVDGRRMEFMVDTGASTIALRASDAAMLGIHPSASDYKVKVQTANGEGRGALARLNMVEIENIVVRDVVALVQPDDSLKENLLGMTFLSKVRWTYDRGQLILDQ
jgi:aspartyl protease family protein